MVIKQTMQADITVKDRRARFVFSPILNFLLSEQGAQYLSMYDQLRFQGFKIKITPNIANFTKSLMMYYRWFRDGDPSKNTLVQTSVDTHPPLGYSQAILFDAKPEVAIINAQSAQSRYINPSTQNNIYTSIYAQNLQEKSRYMQCFEVYDYFKTYGEGKPTEEVAN